MKEVSPLLRAWTDGDHAARNELVALVYEELRNVAHNDMRHEPQRHLLQTTALASPAIVKCDWTIAKLWLHHQLTLQSP